MRHFDKGFSLNTKIYVNWVHYSTGGGCAGHSEARRSRILLRSWSCVYGTSLYELDSGAGDLFSPSEKVTRL